MLTVGAALGMEVRAQSMLKSFCQLIPGLKSKQPLRSRKHRKNLEFPGLIWISMTISETKEILGIALSLGGKCNP